MSSTATAEQELNRAAIAEGLAGLMRPALLQLDSKVLALRSPSLLSHLSSLRSPLSLDHIHAYQSLSEC